MITLILLLIFCLEAHCDYHVIRAQRIDGVKSDNDMWHYYKFWMWVVVFLLMVCFTGNFLILVPAVIVRGFTSQIYLNYLRGFSADHLGNGFVDSILKRTIGARVVTMIKIFLLPAVFACEIIYELIIFLK
jgi:hypothetical protein